MRPMRLLPLATFLWATAALAQSPQPAQPAVPPKPPCQDEASRQFDFWIGDWDVFLPNGKQAGTNRIATLFGGCVLHENWKTPRFEGQSFNRYDASRNVWHQTWVDSGGNLLLLEGRLEGGAMVMSDASLPGKRDADALNEIRWSRNEDGSVRQLWRASKDGGKTWTVAFDGRYVRSARPQPK
jgi:hypothetical protein